MGPVAPRLTCPLRTLLSPGIIYALRHIMLFNVLKVSKWVFSIAVFQLELVCSKRTLRVKLTNGFEVSSFSGGLVPTVSDIALSESDSGWTKIELASRTIDSQVQFWWDRR